MILNENLSFAKGSLEKLKYSDGDRSVIYRSKMAHGKNKRNFKVFSCMEFIASITQHIPETSFQLVRYYGWYSNRMRGDRKKQEERVVEKDGKLTLSPLCSKFSLTGYYNRIKLDPSWVWSVINHIARLRNRNSSACYCDQVQREEHPFPSFLSTSLPFRQSSEVNTVDFATLSVMLGNVSSDEAGQSRIIAIPSFFRGWGGFPPHWYSSYRSGLMSFLKCLVAPGLLCTSPS